ncbi:radical SAM family heme chaperone HemW [Alteromonas lipolytica]|uniref:Heme chaperone HemW n=1 Tax=Alteromonas lipolytica TaxID=1856405 RepID=A0A1E8F9M3_9ALTE|nr:radical SAM family heme chaperone HemW [Alteromonas lipolytica]OFI32624.1 YggW family oxidoreductase [Alteromonas lipolytica]GGF74597.1 YggW family oxidoreductase [Alteromonas lipolytica]
MRTPPLGLYIHIPWCVQKCPYCDFNSHALKGGLPEQEYVAHLLADLEQDARITGDRPVQTIFIGGGTPSLFSPDSIGHLLSEASKRVPFAPDIEITLEANPGTIEAARFNGYVKAGINRFSIGIQSFQAAHLKALGRIHDPAQALFAINQAKQSGVGSFNLDLMHGLPGQSLQNALDDLTTAMAQQPAHLSWYQLTIEPNTPFYSRPPQLPDDDILWDIQDEGHKRLSQAGYEQYEISGYSQRGFQCRHNLNYWRFGDYLGIGCGAHGKITDINSATINRTVKVKHPRGYMTLNRPYLDQSTLVDPDDLAFEFFMNRFRLVEPCPKQDFTDFTGSSLSYEQQKALQQAVENGLLTETSTHWQVTVLGRRYLNTLLSAFV